MACDDSAGADYDEAQLLFSQSWQMMMEHGRSSILCCISQDVRLVFRTSVMELLKVRIYGAVRG